MIYEERPEYNTAAYEQNIIGALARAQFGKELDELNDCWENEDSWQTDDKSEFFDPLCDESDDDAPVSLPETQGYSALREVMRVKKRRGGSLSGAIHKLGNFADSDCSDQDVPDDVEDMSPNIKKKDSVSKPVSPAVSPSKRRTSLLPKSTHRGTNKTKVRASGSKPVSPIKHGASLFGGSGSKSASPGKSPGKARRPTSQLVDMVKALEFPSDEGTSASKLVPSHPRATEAVMQEKKVTPRKPKSCHETNQDMETSLQPTVVERKAVRCASSAFDQRSDPCQVTAPVEQVNAVNSGGIDFPMLSSTSESQPAQAPEASTSKVKQHRAPRGSSKTPKDETPAAYNIPAASPAEKKSAPKGSSKTPKNKTPAACIPAASPAAVKSRQKTPKSSAKRQRPALSDDDSGNDTALRTPKKKGAGRTTSISNAAAVPAFGTPTSRRSGLRV